MPYNDDTYAGYGLPPGAGYGLPPDQRDNTLGYGYNNAPVPPGGKTVVRGGQGYDDTQKGYADLLRRYDEDSRNTKQGYSNLIANQQGAGDSERMALKQHYTKQYADSAQSMISRGLGNTTVLDSAAHGISNDESASQIKLNDALRREQNELRLQGLGYSANAQQGYASLGGQKLGFMGQWAGQQEGFKNQGKLAGQQYGYNRALGAQEFGYKTALNKQSGELATKRDYAQAGYQSGLSSQGYQQNSYLADQDFERNRRAYYMSHGGQVPGPYGHGDTVPTMLQPREFVLSHQMIADLQSGEMTHGQLLKKLKG